MKKYIFTIILAIMIVTVVVILLLTSDNNNTGNLSSNEVFAASQTNPDSDSRTSIPDIPEQTYYFNYNENVLHNEDNPSSYVALYTPELSHGLGEPVKHNYNGKCDFEYCLIDVSLSKKLIGFDKEDTMIYPHTDYYKRIGITIDENCTLTSDTYYLNLTISIKNLSADKVKYCHTVAGCYRLTDNTDNYYIKEGYNEKVLSYVQGGLHEVQCLKPERNINENTYYFEPEEKTEFTYVYMIDGDQIDKEVFWKIGEPIWDAASNTVFLSFIPSEYLKG